MPGSHKSIKRERVYRALRRKGYPKAKAAAISNAGRTHVQRSRMSRKAARTARMRWGRDRRRG